MDHAEKIEYRISENSWIARAAGFFLRSSATAVVIGHTIYLYGAKAETLQEDLVWLRHELMHVLQFKRGTTIVFLLKYIMESIVKGYRNNCNEVEARKAEQEIGFETKFKVVSRRRS